ncbi:MAG: hypothetical protein JOZ90_11025 [Alphaproteobacteria bacterium]|nr:hypothetical protein [Alphaproteobacteria bacterium]MBV9371009.1 hypothetical protein [Alphaproteobacteria bacterium]MBV9901618.1 hypothetical protein [Alphaproteobacteria bacterium]
MSDLYTQNRRPTHRLYQVIGHGKKASWREIGAAWPNKDGGGSASNAPPSRSRAAS